MKKYILISVFTIIVISCLVIFIHSRIRFSIPDSYADLVLLRIGLEMYADKHHGLFPNGNSSTEVFQKLIDDEDLASRCVFFDLNGKSLPTTNKISPNNVCFDFTEGTDPKSPSWVPVLIPTGYLINYKTGQAIKLKTNSIVQNKIWISYATKYQNFPTIIYYFHFFPYHWDHVNIMLDKPSDADTSQYRQLTPDGSL